MKKYKRIIAGLMASVTVLAQLTACGSGSAGAPSGEVDENGVTKDNITLSYWGFEDLDLMTQLAESFMEKYPNITVEVKQMTDMSTDLTAAASNNEFPDVFISTDSDTALANQWWADITEYVDNDPETEKLMGTIQEYGIGKFDTNHRYAMPTWYQPCAIFVDKNVLDKLNLSMPDPDWTWEDMIKLIQDATVDDRTGMKYYGLGYYNRLDSLYGIAAATSSERTIKGEFGFNGTDFDLQYWAVGEQQFSDLKLAGYVAPQQNTQAMEDWTGDYGMYFGSTGHVAVFSEGWWTFQNIWNTNVVQDDGTTVYYQDLYDMDIYPYVTPSVTGEKEHNVLGNMYLGGVSYASKYPYEAYMLLKYMNWGVDGWKKRIEIYADENNVNSSGVPLKAANMPMPLTTDEEVWTAYKAMFPQDAEHKEYWDRFFDNMKRPVPYGWYNIAGYWNFCDQYFNSQTAPGVSSAGIHNIIDEGLGKAADYVEEANLQANYYHALYMIAYFGHDGYDVLSDDEIAWYQSVVDAGGVMTGIGERPVGDK
jgi:multiple sugar transport system substrate-binding protein